MPFALHNALTLGLSTYLWQTHVISLGTVYLAFYFVNLLSDPIEQIRASLAKGRGPYNSPGLVNERPVHSQDC